MALVMNGSSRPVNLRLRYEAPTAFAPAVSWRLSLWLGMRLPVSRVWLRLGLTPPPDMITEEKCTHEAGRRTYVPAMVQQERLWAIGDVAQRDEETLQAFSQAFLSEVHAVDPGYRRRAARQDSWQPAHKPPHAVRSQAAQGGCQSP